MSYRIGTVCQVGTFNPDNLTFKKIKDTTIGTIQRKSMLQICGVTDPVKLTPEMVTANMTRLQEKLVPKLKQNLNALYNQLKYIVEDMPSDCKMLRISSDLLPMYDHAVLGAVYTPEVLKLVDTLLNRCKRYIDAHDVRVCTHPDQYVIINSDKQHVRDQAYRSLYMHKYFMERLTTVDQTSINIHLNGHLDHLPEIDQGLYGDLVTWLSFENEDKRGKVFVSDTLNTLKVCERYGIKMLFDIHHDHVMTGDFISVNDPIIDRIVKTWEGARPIFHLSQGREHPTDKKHSDFILDKELIDHASNYLGLGDIEIEAKAKTCAVKSFSNSIR